MKAIGLERRDKMEEKDGKRGRENEKIKDRKIMHWKRNNIERKEIDKRITKKKLKK